MLEWNISLLSFFFIITNSYRFFISINCVPRYPSSRYIFYYPSEGKLDVLFPSLERNLVIRLRSPFYYLILLLLRRQCSVVYGTIEWNFIPSFLPRSSEYTHTSSIRCITFAISQIFIQPKRKLSFAKTNQNSWENISFVKHGQTSYKIAKRGGELGRNPIMIKRWLPAHPWNKNHRLERICFLWTRRHWVVVVIPPSSSPLTASPFEWNRQRDEKPSARLSKARSRFHKKGGDYVIMRMLSRDSRYRPASKHSLFEPLPRINPIPPHFRKFAPTSSTSVSPVSRTVNWEEAIDKNKTCEKLFQGSLTSKIREEKFFRKTKIPSTFLFLLIERSE